MAEAPAFIGTTTSVVFSEAGAGDTRPVGPSRLDRDRGRARSSPPTTLPVTGDEPHYLNHGRRSRAGDRTLDLRSGYAREARTGASTAAPLNTHVVIVNDRWGPYHAPEALRSSWPCRFSRVGPREGSSRSVFSRVCSPGVASSAGSA